MLCKNCYDHVKPIIQSTKLQIASILPKFLRQSYTHTKWAGDSDKIKKFRKNFRIFLGKFLKQNHRYAKFSYSFFLKVAQKFARIENFAPPEAQGSRMPLVRVVYRDLLRRIASHSNQGRNDEGLGAQFPGRRITMRAPNDCGAPKCPNNVTRTSVQYICFWTISGSNIGAPNLHLARAQSNFVEPLTVIPYSSALSMYMKWGVIQLHSYVGHNSLS